MITILYTFGLKKQEKSEEGGMIGKEVMFYWNI